MLWVSFFLLMSWMYHFHDKSVLRVSAAVLSVLLIYVNISNIDEITANSRAPSFDLDFYKQHIKKINFFFLNSRKSMFQDF